MLIQVILALILCWLVVCGLVAWFLVQGIKRAIADQVENFVSPGPEDKDGNPGPSPLAIIIQNAAIILAGELQQRISAMMMGKASAMSKAMTQLEGEVIQENLAGANPALGAILSASPGLQKKIARSPALAMALQAISQGGLGSLFGNRGNGHSPTAAGPTQSKMGF